MNDRDHFAAAALTGLLAASHANLWADDLWADDLCRTAFGWADAMLCERASTNFAEISSTLTDHDAAPAARARTDDGSVGTDKAEPLPVAGTGDTQEPVAWAVIGMDRMKGHVIGLHDTAMDAHARVGRMVSYGDIFTADKVEVVPLYRSPTLTDNEVEAVELCIFQQAVPQKTAVTMRRMLERLK